MYSITVLGYTSDHSDQHKAEDKFFPQSFALLLLQVPRFHTAVQHDDDCDHGS